jgi:hypothetical protein
MQEDHVVNYWTKHLGCDAGWANATAPLLDWFADNPDVKKASADGRGNAPLSAVTLAPTIA